MILLDANVFLYSSDRTSRHHETIETWLEPLRNSDETIGLPWITIWAFMRIATNARLAAMAVSPETAMAVVTAWAEQPNVKMIDPGQRHLEMLDRALTESQVRGPDTTDAVMAALAMEHGATLASTDVGFRRFPSLKWINPLDAR